MASNTYAANVFVNCPFTPDYLRFRNAILFTVLDCGFNPRCSLEEDDSGHVRFQKIQQLIAECKFGIHDISFTELDSKYQLPRFNMPLELGVFLGAKSFGNGKQKRKNTLILDRQQYRYQKFISDISGHDIQSHRQQLGTLITIIRNWLNSASGRKRIPGGIAINRRYKKYLRDLPRMCDQFDISVDELTYNDDVNMMEGWLKSSRSDL